MIALILISAAVFLTYTMIILNLAKEIPSSLSDTYYWLEQKSEDTGWVFMFAMIVMGTTLTPSLIEISEGHPLQFLSFLCPASIIFVGAAPRFKSVGIESRIHIVAALLSALCGCLWIILIADLWWSLLVSIVAIGAVALRSKTIKRAYTFWLEMVVFLSVYSSALAITIKSAL